MAGSSDDEERMQKEELSPNNGTHVHSEINQSGSVANLVQDLRYKVDDVPPWYLCIILGFQVGHTMAIFCTAVECLNEKHKGVGNLAQSGRGYYIKVFRLERKDEGLK